MEKHIFEISNLNIYYHDFHAVKNVSVAIPGNAITAIIGASGCGKSSFLRSMNRMNDFIPASKTTGQILFHGVNIHDPLVSEVSLRRRVGMVFQKPNPFPFSIFDNVAYGLRIQNIKDKAMIAERVEESLKRAFLARRCQLATRLAYSCETRFSCRENRCIYGRFFDRMNYLCIFPVSPK